MMDLLTIQTHAVNDDIDWNVTLIGHTIMGCSSIKIVFENFVVPIYASGMICFYSLYKGFQNARMV